MSVDCLGQRAVLSGWVWQSPLEMYDSHFHKPNQQPTGWPQLKGWCIVSERCSWILFKAWWRGFGVTFPMGCRVESQQQQHDKILLWLSWYMVSQIHVWEVEHREILSGFYLKYRLNHFLKTKFAPNIPMVYLRREAKLSDLLLCWFSAGWHSTKQ